MFLRCSGNANTTLLNACPRRRSWSVCSNRTQRSCSVAKRTCRLSSVARSFSRRLMVDWSHATQLWRAIHPSDAPERPTGLAHHQGCFARVAAVLSADRAFFTATNEQSAREQVPPDQPLSADPTGGLKQVDDREWSIPTNPALSRLKPAGGPVLRRKPATRHGLICLRRRNDPVERGTTA